MLGYPSPVESECSQTSSAQVTPDTPDQAVKCQYREFRPCCDHNNWDNVRVSKKVMTLRCRVCQKQWRAHVEEVWSKWKCGVYSSGACHAGCEKLHINYRKQGLEARFKTHGGSVIDHVRVGRTQYDLQDKVKTLKNCLDKAGAGQDRPDAYTHEPYSWGASTLQSVE